MTAECEVSSRPLTQSAPSAAGGAKEKEHFLGVDLCRFLSASAVLIFHCCFYYLLTRSDESPSMRKLGDFSPLVFPGAEAGWVGVEVFFVISGFVISFSAAGRSKAEFVRTRFLRLWPTVWLCATLCLAVAAATYDQPWPHLLRAWFGSMAILPIPPWIDGVYWTLPVEISFYTVILFGAVEKPERRMETLATALGVYSLLFWMLCAALLALPFSPQVKYWTMKVVNHKQLDMALMHHGIYFSLGMLMHRFRDCRRNRLLLPGLVMAAFFEIHLQNAAMNERMLVSTSALIPCGLWGLAVILLYLSIRFNGTLAAALGRGRSRVVKSLGMATYPLYLVHVPLWYGFTVAFRHLGLPPILSWSLALAIAILAALIIALTLEPSWRAACARMIDRRILGRKLAAEPLRN